MANNGFEPTPEIHDFLATRPEGEGGLSPHEVREILEEAFDAARLMRSQSQSALDATATTMRPEPHERILLRADAIQALVSGGRFRFENWAIEKRLHPGEAVKIYEEAMESIRELTDATAADYIATSRARYEDIFEKLMRRGELKEAANVQAKLDKLNQVGVDEDGDTLGAMARTIEKLSRPQPKPVRP